MEEQDTKRPITGAQPRERLRGLMVLEVASVSVWLAVVWLSDRIRPLQEILLQNISTTDTYGVEDLLIALLIGLAVLLIFKRFSFFGTFISLVLGFMVFTGAMLYVGPIGALVFAAILVAYERLRPSFLSNNLLILFALLFGAIPIGLTHSVTLLLWFLILLSIYDVVGVFLIRFIPKLAAEAADKQIPLILLVPQRDISWWDTPKQKTSATILGAGDVLLPAIFLSATTLALGWGSGLWILLGAVVGMIGNTLFATLIRSGIPAMPLLSAGMLIAYLLVR